MPRIPHVSRLWRLAAPLLLAIACSHDTPRDNPLDPQLTPPVDLVLMGYDDHSILIGGDTYSRFGLSLDYTTQQALLHWGSTRRRKWVSSPAMNPTRSPLTFLPSSSPAWASKP